MNKLLFLAFVTAIPAQAQVMPRNAMLKEIVKREAIENRVSVRLLSAIIKVESNWNPWATHYESNYHHFVNVAFFARESHITAATETRLQRTALGLMQLTGGTARSMGYHGALTKLLDPSLNVHWGAKYLRQLADKYHNVHDQIAAYNAGGAYRSYKGVYVNQSYVNQVGRLLKVGKEQYE